MQAQNSGLNVSLAASHANATAASTSAMAACSQAQQSGVVSNDHWPSRRPTDARPWRILDGRSVCDFGLLNPDVGGARADANCVLLPSSRPKRVARRPIDAIADKAPAQLRPQWSVSRRVNPLPSLGAQGSDHSLADRSELHFYPMFEPMTVLST